MTILYKLVLSLLNTLVIVFLIFLINALFHMPQSIMDTIYGLTQKKTYVFSLFLILVLGYIVCLGLINYLKRFELKNTYFIIPVIFMLVLFCVVILTSKPGLINDPKAYYEEGIKIANNLSHFNITNIYHGRVIAYTAPIFAVFGNELIYVQIINIFLIVASTIIYTIIIFKDFGKQIAFLFLTLSVLTLDYYWLATLASHDIAALFYFSLVLVLIYYLKKPLNISKSVIIILLLAFLIFVNDLQRGIKLPLVVALFFTVMLQIKTIKQGFKTNLGAKLMITVILSLGLFVLFSNFKNNSSVQSSHYALENVIYSYNQIGTKGDYSGGEELRRNYIPLVPKSSKRILVLEKFFTQLKEYPFEILELIRLKMTTLGSLNPQNYFYMDKKFNDEGNYITYQIIRILAYTIKIPILLLAILGLIRSLISSKLKDIGTKLYVIYPLVFLPMVLLSEVNPTYAILIQAFILFLAAYGLKWLLSKKVSFYQGFKENWSNLKTSIIATIVLGLMVFTTASAYTVITSKRLQNFSTITTMPESILEIQNNEKIPYEIFLNKTTRDVDGSKLLLKLDKKALELRFFLRTKTSPERLNISINDQKVINISFKEDGRIGIYDGFYYYYIEHIMDKANSELMFYFEGADKLLVKDLLIFE